jgi:hypothetical protein
MAAPIESNMALVFFMDIVLDAGFAHPMQVTDRVSFPVGTVGARRDVCSTKFRQQGPRLSLPSQLAKSSKAPSPSRGPKAVSCWSTPVTFS